MTPHLPSTYTFMISVNEIYLQQQFTYRRHRLWSNSLSKNAVLLQCKQTSYRISKCLTLRNPKSFLPLKKKKIIII